MRGVLKRYLKKKKMNKKIIIAGNGASVGMTFADQLFNQQVEEIERINTIISIDQYQHLTKAERNAIILPIRTTPKVSRNQSCPCGSGKKYKKCCLLKK
jgi:preprotein translocase subunit SecA